jgi:CHASE3 domain sensor protein
MYALLNSPIESQSEKSEVAFLLGMLAIILVVLSLYLGVTYAHAFMRSTENSQVEQSQPVIKAPRYA